jgi:hypothetical protein
MKILSTLFIAAALSLIACGGGAETDAVESQSDGTETTGDEMGTDDGMGTEEAPVEEAPAEEAPVEEGAEATEGGEEI